MKSLNICSPFAQYYQIEYNSTDIERNGTHIEYVDRIIIHEEYDDWYLIHDISLLRLRNAIQVGGYIELPPHWVLTPHGTPVTLIGWGLNAVNCFAFINLICLILIEF